MLMDDMVTLVKKDGTEIPNIRADVQPKMIFIDDESLPIDEEDHLIRKLPNGRSESYLVLEANYWGKDGGWQLEVRREGIISPEKPGHQIHQYGQGSRVNIKSQDFSTNIINEANVFAQARSAVETQVAKDYPATT